MTIAKLSIALIFGGLVTANAEAKVGDTAWAKCVWENDAQAAEFWISGPVPEWNTRLDAPELLLGYRLAVGCNPEIEGDGDKNISRDPNWKSLASRLKRERPDRANNNGIEPSVFLCKNFGDGTLYLHEIVRRESDGAEKIFYRQYFAEHMGKPAKLPQDLRVVPEQGAKLMRQCFNIDGAGNLVTNAGEPNA
jgi:hypothetical protein